MLNFASLGHLKAAVRRLVPASDCTTAHVVLDLAAVARVDPAGVGALRAVHRDLAVRGVALLVAGANARVRAALRRCWGDLDSVSLLVFPTTHDAVVYAECVAY